MMPASWRRHAAMVTACLVTMLAGGSLIFTDFSEDLKEHWNLQQSEIGVIETSGVVGASLGLPVGLVYEWLGARACFLITAMLGSVSSFLFFTSRWAPHFYSNHWQLLAVYWVGVGIATCFMFLLSTAVCLESTPPHRHGLITGILGACWWIGAASLSAIFNGFFVGNEHSVADFFLFLATALLVANVGAVFFLKSQPQHQHKKEDEDANQGADTLNDGMNQTEFTNPLYDILEEDVVIKTGRCEDMQAVQRAARDNQIVACDHTESVTRIHYNLALNPPQENESLAERIGVNMLTNIDFCLVSLAYFLGASVSLAYILNFNTFGVSYGVGLKVVHTLDVVALLCASVVKGSVGALSDHTLQTCNRLLYVTAFTLVQAIVFFLCIWLADNTHMYSAAAVFIYITNAVFTS